MEILGVREHSKLQAIAKAQPSFFHLSSYMCEWQVTSSKNGTLNPKSFPSMMYNNLDSVFRPKGWTPAFQSLSTGVIQGHGELAFQMAILNRM